MGRDYRVVVAILGSLVVLAIFGVLTLALRWDHRIQGKVTRSSGEQAAVEISP